MFEVRSSGLGYLVPGSGRNDFLPSLSRRCSIDVPYLKDTRHIRGIYGTYTGHPAFYLLVLLLIIDILIIG
jgi:hypothetical protein